MRKKIAVLFGGRSTEYDVSLVSASADLRAIDTQKYEVIPIGITREGRWYLYRGEHSGIETGIWISFVRGNDELDAAIRKAFIYDREVIAEEEIKGFEVGCAVMGIEELTAGRVDEIELNSDFFDFHEKYSLETSTIHMPARIDRETESRIRETAKKIYRLLGCSGFARVDMFLSCQGEIVFNEVNTIPGMTAHSRFPNMMKGIGLSFSDLVNRILDLYAKK